MSVLCWSQTEPVVTPAITMFKFVAITVCICVAAVHAGHYGHHGGHSDSYRKQDDYGTYAFGYNIKDGYGNVNGREEKGDHGHVAGSYYLGEIDGRHRSVQYVADKLGFRATIKTNEHGTKTSEPAFAPYTSAFGKTVPSGSIHHGHGHGYGDHGVHHATHDDHGHGY